MRSSETSTIADVSEIGLEGQTPATVEVVVKVVVKVPVPLGLTVYVPVSVPMQMLVPSLTVSAPALMFPKPSAVRIPVPATVP
jgi:hypothetical protein